MLNRKNRFFKNYKRHGYKLEDKVRLDNFRKECQEAVEKAKLLTDFFHGNVNLQLMTVFYPTLVT